MKKSTQRIVGALVVVIASTTFAVGAGSTVAHAAEDTAVVIGYDQDGNPIYQSDDGAINDPDEEGGLPPTSPDPDVDEPTLPPPSPSMRPICDESRTVKVSNLPNKLEVDWTDSVINTRAYEVEYTVTAETSKTFTWGISASATAEIKAAIFAKVEVSLNGSIEHSKTTKYGSTIKIKVRGHDTVKVDRGMWQERFSYSFKKQDKYCRVTSGSGSGKAPYRQAWHIY